LVAVVVVLLIVLVGVDVGTRVAMEHQLAQRADSYAGAKDVSVTIHAFPWLPNLLAQGRVSKITAHANQLTQGNFVLSGVEITVTGVRVDRHLLLNKQQLDIVSIDSGTVTAGMTQANLDQLVGEPVTLGSGTAQVTVGGVTVNGTISVDNGVLRLSAEGIPVSVPIPSLPLLPCLSNVTILPGRLVGTCTFNQIPPALKAALQSALPAG
jgi:hypothetical protein